MNNTCFSFRYDSNHELPSLRITLSVLLAITSVTAVSLNSLILYSIWKNPSLHKPSYLLLANLALADLLFGAIEQPLMLFEHLAYIKRWKTLYCYITAFSHLLGYWLASVCLYCLTLISVDRLLAIRLKNRYQSFVTSRRIWMVTVPYWVGMFFFFLTFINLRVFVQYVGNVIAPSLLFMFLAAITICYSMASHSLKKLISSESSSSQQSPDNQTSTFDVSQYQRCMNTMLLVMLTTLLLYLPSFCSFIVHFIVDGKGLPSILPYKIFDSSKLFVAMNSTVNPLLYLWRLQHIRQAVKTTVKRILRREQVQVHVV